MTGAVAAADSVAAGPTLRDPAAQARLERDGFAVVAVPPGVIEQLAELYSATRPAEMPGFLATTADPLE